MNEFQETLTKSAIWNKKYVKPSSEALSIKERDANPYGTKGTIKHRKKSVGMKGKNKHAVQCGTEENMVP